MTTKRKPTTPKPPIIPTLLKAITKAYPRDHSKPGLTVSFLEDGKWYVSICRWPKDGFNRLVVHKATDSSLEAAIKQVATQFLDSGELIDQLRAAIK